MAGAEAEALRKPRGTGHAFSGHPVENSDQKNHGDKADNNHGDKKQRKGTWRSSVSRSLRCRTTSNIHACSE